MLRDPAKPDNRPRCPSCSHVLGDGPGRRCPVCGYDIFGTQGRRSNFSIGRAIVGGCDALCAGYAVLVAVVIIVLVIQLALAVGQEIFRVATVAAIGELGEIYASILAVSLSLLFFAPLNAGIALMGVHAYRGERLCISEMFAGFRRFSALLAVNLLSILVLAACMLPLVAAVAGSIMVTRASPSLAMIYVLAGFAVSIVLCIWMGVRLSFSILACLDPNQDCPGPIESMRLSLALTRNIVPHLLFVYALAGLIALSSILMFGIGFILVGQPLAIGIIGATYALVVGRPGPDSEPDPQQGPQPTVEPDLELVDDALASLAS